MEEFSLEQIFTGTYPPAAALWCQMNGAHIVELETEPGEVWRKFQIVKSPEPAPAEVMRVYEDAVQAHLDATAQSRGYDSTYTCLSYLSSTAEVWKREATAFNAWRDSVWRKAHEILHAYCAGEIEQPTTEEVIAQLPVIDWGDPEEPEA